MKRRGRPTAEIEFENAIARAVIESGLAVGTVIKSLSTVLIKLNKVKENLANVTDVRKATECAEVELLITQSENAQV